MTILTITTVLFLFNCLQVLMVICVEWQTKIEKERQT